ncbi:hypothetical protein FGU65_03790 [Methanoculleus sp. FWC-SCC1]|uniref:Uncharacterized protein n=1 Tax=Methanoculleus frigidifontis TaxID=2584085 RepID=A0ABT8M7W8_9EURY|nr:hypothetical protein [Methanoculleus sp. FWC-SCC1]MDN7024020.1 hypothetical protein [Methanoculleus sp. FWC-SCC1]
METGWFIDPYRARQRVWITAGELDRIETEYPWKVRLQQLLEKYLGYTCVKFCEMFGENIDLTDYSGESTYLSTDIEQSLLHLHEYLGFEFPNPGSVVNYLRQNPGIYDAVLYACMLAEEAFGQRAQITLDVYSDPEIEDEYLTIYIRQHTYDTDIMEQIDVICGEYEAALGDQPGWIVVTTDFRPPTE